MSHSGASVRMMSHKRERYESEWSKCEKKKRVRVNCITCVHQISETSDVPRMQQRSVEIRRSKCKSYVVLRGAILEQ